MTKKPTWVDRGWYVVTEFERTPSINFTRAVELAETHPGFTPLMDERNILVYRNIYRPENLLQFQEMAQLIKNWKGAKLYIKGERVQFDHQGSGIECYIQTVLDASSRGNADDPCERFSRDQFTLGCLGCRRSHVSMAWQTSSGFGVPAWFQFGKLDQNRVYHIHKHDLESAVIGDLIEYRHCPLLDLDRIRELVQRLPRSIDPRKDREWKYQRRDKDRVSAPANAFSGRATQEPEILPASESAYHTYLQRKLTGV